MPLFPRRQSGAGHYNIERLGAFSDAVIARLVFLAIPFLFISHYLLDPPFQQIQADTGD